MLNINIRLSLFINIIIFFSFLGHFGITIFGQDIYYYYLIEIILLLSLLFKNGLKVDISKIEVKLFILFLFIALLGGIISTSTNISDFKGQSILTSSLKGLVYLFLNIFIIFVMVTYGKNERFFNDLSKVIKYVIILYLIYIILESYHDYYQKNFFIREILNFFHTSSRSIDKNFLNLLGHEHSNSSIFVLVLYSYMVANLINQKVVFRSYLFDISIIIILIIALFLLESKLGYVIFGVLNLSIIVISLMNAKVNLKYFLTLIVLSFIVFYLYFTFSDKVEKAMGLILNYDHPSFNIRANFLIASTYLMYKFPILGTGLNNFKFYIEDAINTLHTFTWLNIKTEGDIDGYSELEFSRYVYGDIGVPDPANMILGIGAEMGIIGLLTFLAIIILIFFKIFYQTRNKLLNKQDKVLSHFLFFSLIVVIFSFAGFYQLYFILQWIVIGLNISFIYHIKKKYKNSV